MYFVCHICVSTSVKAVLHMPSRFIVCLHDVSIIPLRCLNFSVTGITVVCRERLLCHSVLSSDIV